MDTSPVLVTGAAGFVATNIVSQLLARGDRVRGTVRSLARREGYRHLLELDGAAERLELVEADLLTPGSFDAATQGVRGVFHTASPYVMNVADPQRDLVDPAVLGTRHVLAACDASPTVRRVVLTSSVAAMTDEPDGRVLTDADWNTTSSLERNPYYFSKAEAERAAWAHMEQETRHYDLVAVNPFLVIGPEAGPGVNTSNAVIADITKPTKYPAIMDLTWGLVDVRDVAATHIAAMDTPGAHGRYLCCAARLTMREVVGIIRSRYGSRVTTPRISLDSALGTTLMKAGAYTQPKGIRSYLQSHLGRPMNFDNSRTVNELGITFRPIEETLVDTIDDLIARGHVRSRA